MPIKDMIDAIADGRLADANSAFEDEMEDLITSRLDDKKIEIASGITHDGDEEDLEDFEEQEQEEDVYEEDLDDEYE